MEDRKAANLLRTVDGVETVEMGTLKRDGSVAG